MSPRQHILAAGLLVLYLIPLWLYPLFPSQDGPSHLYNTIVFSDLLWNPKSLFAPFYTLNWRPFPNWTFTILASLFYPMLPILVVEKIILSLYLIGFIAAAFYFYRSINTEKTVLGFGAFLFGYNWFLLMGFYNFCLSIPLALWAIGYGLRHRGAIRGRRIAALAGLFVALYFSHIVSFGIAVLVLALLFGCVGQKRLPALLQLLLTGVPAAVLFLLNLLMQPSTKETRYHAPWDWLAAVTFSFRIGPWFHRLEVVWLVAFWLLLLAWLAQSLARLKQGSIEERIWWLPTALMLVLGLALPNNLLGGTTLNERFALFFGLFLLATLSLRTWTLPKWWLGVAFGALVAVQLAYIHVSFHQVKRRLDPFQRAATRIEGPSRVLPLTFTENVVGFYVKPLLHADNYLLLQTRSVSPNNYEAWQHYFPVTYKDGAPLAAPANWVDPEEYLKQGLARYYNYVLLWNAKPVQLQGFTEAFGEGDVRLLKRQ